MLKATWAAIALSLAGTASTHLFAADLTGAEGRAELISKVYDLSHLRMRETDFETEEVLLLPASHIRASSRERGWIDLADAFIDHTQTILWEEVEYDGRTIDSSGDGHFYLKVPQKTHDEVAQLLTFYEDLCTARTEMRLFWVEVPQGTNVPLGLVPNDLAFDWIDQLPDNSYTLDQLEVPAATAGVLKQLLKTPVIAEADVEIAQGVAALDPYIHSVSSGRWAMIHAVPAVGGLQLSMTYSNMGKPRVTAVELELMAAIGSEGKPVDGHHLGGAIQLIRQAGNVASTRVFVPEGMVSISKVSSTSGTTTLLVAAPNKVAPVEHSYQLTGDRKDRGTAILTRSLMPLETRWKMGEDFCMPRRWSADWCWRSQVDSSDWMRERVVEGLAGDLVGVVDVGGYMVFHTAHGVSRDQLPMARMELDRVIKRARSFMVKRPSYMVTLRGIQGGAQEILSIQQAVAGGAQSTWFNGAERTFINDYDVEVAQYAAVQDPTVLSQMEGSLVELSVDAGVNGSLQIRLHSVFNLQVETKEMDFKSPFYATFERTAYQKTVLNTVSKLQPGGKPGVWSTSIGGQGDGAIMIQMDVKRID